MNMNCAHSICDVVSRGVLRFVYGTGCKHIKGSAKLEAAPLVMTDFMGNKFHVLPLCCSCDEARGWKKGGALCQIEPIQTLWTYYQG
jgi:hypothetical protein